MSLPVVDYPVKSCAAQAGIMEEMLEDTLQMEEDEELEEEADAEVDKVLYDLTEGKLGQAGTVKDELPVCGILSVSALPLTRGVLVVTGPGGGRRNGEGYGAVPTATEWSSERLIPMSYSLFALDSVLCRCVFYCYPGRLHTARVTAQVSTAVCEWVSLDGAQHRYRGHRAKRGGKVMSTTWKYIIHHVSPMISPVLKFRLYTSLLRRPPTAQKCLQLVPSLVVRGSQSRPPM